MRATSHHSTLCLNPSNHPLVPPDGLVLEAGKATPVPAEMGDYLRGLGCQVEDEATPTPTAKRAATSAPKE